MTKEVLLTLQGLQFDQREENADKIEMVMVGDYYKKNDKHYVIYEAVSYTHLTLPTKRIV